MINLFKVKAKQRETAENVNGKAPVKKQTAGELRLHKGIVEGHFLIHVFLLTMYGLRHLVIYGPTALTPL